jgi:hypothetical protein
MQDFKGIAMQPIASANTCGAPTVSSYVGYYPLDVATFVGAKSATDKMNSTLLFTWQQSYVSSGNWYQMSSPAAVPVTLTIPTGMTVSKAINTVTLVPIPFKLTGAALTYDVTDDPVEIFLKPVNGSVSVSGCTQP